MPGLLVHDGRHGIHPFHLVHVPRGRSVSAHRPPRVVREARAVGALVAVATTVLSALWVCAAVGLADASWWRLLVVGAAVAFAAAGIASLLWARDR